MSSGRTLSSSKTLPSTKTLPPLTKTLPSSVSSDASSHKPSVLGRGPLQCRKAAILASGARIDARTRRQAVGAVYKPGEGEQALTVSIPSSFLARFRRRLPTRSFCSTPLQGVRQRYDATAADSVTLERLVLHEQGTKAGGERHGTACLVRLLR